MEQLSLVSREPWWETPPRPGQDEMTCKWGWLELWSDGSFRFDASSRPTDEQIKARKGCHLPHA
jgi:hypothetical protein